MAGFTPGPWGMFPDDFEQGGWVVDELGERLPPRSQDPFTYISVCKVECMGTKANAKANARLIVAAPDLYAAAKLMIENIDGSYAQVMFASGKLKQAIAKADGKASGTGVEDDGGQG